jgi:large subunit ribosomal protein L3
MSIGLFGRKIGMTQLFEESGQVTPVSVIQAGPCPILQVKTPEKEGYGAIQIGFAEKKAQRTNLSEKGHVKAAGVPVQRILREIRVDDVGGYTVGDAVDVSVFEGTKKVNVTGTTKGRGFSGTTRRWGFKIGRKTHGSHSQREPGSVGQCATPARIFRGKKLPGRMGGVKRTARNLELVQIDTENNLLFVKGSVPGANNGIVFIKTA